MKPYHPRKAPTVAKGPVKFSKRVLRRIKAVRSLVSAIRGFRHHVEAGYRARLAAELRDGETLPDVGLELELTGRLVETALARLEEADRVYRRQVIERRQVNDACRHVARDELHPRLVEVRKEIEMRFGREPGRDFHGIEGATLRKPTRVEPQAATLVRRLKKWELPEPLRPGPDGEREDWLARLEPVTKKLTELLKELQGSELMESVRREERDFEMESFDADYAGALGHVRSVGKLTGLDKKWIRSLVPDVERRRLVGKARQQRDARAEAGRKKSSPSSTG